MSAGALLEHRAEHKKAGNLIELLKKIKSHWAIGSTVANHWDKKMKSDMDPMAGWSQVIGSQRPWGPMLTSVCLLVTKEKVGMWLYVIRFFICSCDALFMFSDHSGQPHLNRWKCEAVLIKSNNSSCILMFTSNQIRSYLRNCTTPRVYQHTEISGLFHTV